MQVGETLSVELSQHADGRYYLRILRIDEGLVCVELTEVPGLINALSEGAARARAAQSGEPYQDTLF
jgi:hypothetical protein